MKILQVISSLGNGGAEKFVVELSNELSKNHDVKVCSFKKIEEWMIFPKKLNKNIEVYDFKKKSGISFKTFIKLFKFLVYEKPDIVHFHLDATVKYILPFILISRNIKFVYTIHSDLNDEKLKLFNRLYKIRFITKKIKLICISDVILKSFIKQYPNLKFYLIENGIACLTRSNNYLDAEKEINRLKINEETKVFISIGRIDENKNQYLQLKTFELLQSENCILLVLGNDPSKENSLLRNLISIKSSNVFFMGMKQNVADYLELSDIFLITSFNEGLPIVALEALSLGKPIITTKAGGMQDVVSHAVNGFICCSFNKEDLMEQAKQCLKMNEEKLLEIKENNIIKFKNHYGIESATKKYLQLYFA